MRADCDPCCASSTRSAGSIFLRAMSIRSGIRAGISRRVAPPLEMIAAGREVEFRALNPRGEILNQILEPLLAPHPHWESFRPKSDALRGTLKPLPALFPEEERSKQPSVFSILRALIDEFRIRWLRGWRWLGAFGYDLLFQFDPIQLKLPRDGVKDLHLFLCDDIYFMDRKKEQIERYPLRFFARRSDHRGLARTATRGQEAQSPLRPGRSFPITRRKSTWRRSKRCAKACGAAIITKWCCARLSAPVFRQPVGAVRAHPARQPQPLRIPPAVRRGATGRRFARDVRAR